MCMQCGLRGISFRDMCYLPDWHVQSCSQQRCLRNVSSRIILVFSGRELVRDVSVEFDLGNRQLIIHGVHVQRRVLGDRCWDMRGLLGRLLQEPYWCRGVHCMRGGEDACDAGCYDGEHVPDVRGREAWGVVWAQRVHGLRSRDVFRINGLPFRTYLHPVSRRTNFAIWQR